MSVAAPAALHPALRKCELTETRILVSNVLVQLAATRRCIYHTVNFIIVGYYRVTDLSMCIRTVGRIVQHAEVHRQLYLHLVRSKLWSTFSYAPIHREVDLRAKSNKQTKSIGLVNRSG